MWSQLPAALAAPLSLSLALPLIATAALLPLDLLPLGLLLLELPLHLLLALNLHLPLLEFSLALQLLLALELVLLTFSPIALWRLALAALGAFTRFALGVDLPLPGFGRPLLLLLPLEMFGYLTLTLCLSFVFASLALAHSLAGATIAALFIERTHHCVALSAIRPIIISTAVGTSGLIARDFARIIIITVRTPSGAIRVSAPGPIVIIFAIRTTVTTPRDCGRTFRIGLLRHGLEVRDLHRLRWGGVRVQSLGLGLHLLPQLGYLALILQLPAAVYLVLLHDSFDLRLESGNVLVHYFRREDIQRVAGHV